MTRKIFNWIKKHPILSLIASFFIYLGMVDVNFLGLFGKSPGFMSGLEPRISENFSTKIARQSNLKR